MKALWLTSTTNLIHRSKLHKEAISIRNYQLKRITKGPLGPDRHKPNMNKNLYLHNQNSQCPLTIFQSNQPTLKINSSLTLIQRSHILKINPNFSNLTQRKTLTKHRLQQKPTQTTTCRNSYKLNKDPSKALVRSSKNYLSNDLVKHPSTKSPYPLY